MEINLTSKLRFVFQSEDDRKSAYDTLIAYRDACNYVSQYIFNHDFILKQSELQSALYHELRQRFGLKSQMTQLFNSYSKLAVFIFTFIINIITCDFCNR